MRTREFISPSTPIIPPVNYHSIATRLMEHQFTPDARPAVLPHIVDCPTLTPTYFKTHGQFERAVTKRRAWCQRYAVGGFSIEPIGGRDGSDGLRFRFATGACATLFRLLHVTDRHISLAKAGE